MIPTAMKKPPKNHPTINPKNGPENNEQRGQKTSQKMKIILLGQWKADSGKSGIPKRKRLT